MPIKKSPIKIKRKGINATVIFNKLEEEEVNNFDEIGVGNDSRDRNTSVRRSDQKFKSPERLGSTQYF